jgi:hypothetical protein
LIKNPEKLQLQVTDRSLRRKAKEFRSSRSSRS